MNESTLIQLKVLVQRAVRPVRAGDLLKRRMRDELLGHVMAIFNEEIERLRDEPAALQAAADRFGDPIELTAQLQSTVPAGEHVRRMVDRFWSKPGEPWWRRAIRQGILIDLLLPVGPFFAWVAAGAPAKNSPLYVIQNVGPQLCLLLLAGFAFTFMADWMRRALYGPKGKSRANILLIAGISGVAFIAACLGIDSLDMSQLLIATGFGLLWTPVGLACLARIAQERLQNQQEWAGLTV